jgi:hypothetical protein
MRKPEKSKLYRRLLGWVLFFMLLVALLELLSVLISNFYLKERICRKVESGLEGKYRLRLGTFTISIVRRSVTFSELTLSPLHIADTSFRYKCHISRMSVRGIGIISMLKNREFECSRFIVEQPLFTVYGTPPGERKPERKKPVKRIKAAHIEIVNASVIRQSLSRKVTSGSFLFSLNVEDLDTDSLLNFSCRDFSLRARDICLKTPDSLYTLTVKGIGMDPERIHVSGIVLKPNYSMYGFGHAAGRSVERLDMSISTIVVKGHKPQKLTEKTIFAEKISIHDTRLEAFRDFRIPSDTSEIKMFQDLLREMKWKLKIDTLDLNRMDVAYLEQRKYDLPGKVFFADVQGEIVNINTHPAALRQNIPIKVNLRGLLMGKGKFALDIRIPPGNLDNRHTIAGSVGSVEATEFNRILENVSPFTIKGGTVDKCSFSFSADKHTSEGAVELRYRDLVLNYKGTKDNSENVPERILSLINNQMFVSGSNPKRNKPPRSEKVTFTRKKEKGMINYWWKSLFSGIISTILPLRDAIPNEAVQRLRNRK